MPEYFETRLGKRCSFWHRCPCLGANYEEEGLARGCQPHIGHTEVLLVSSGLWGHLLLQVWVQLLIVRTSQEGLSWHSVFQHLSGHPESLSSALPSLVFMKETQTPKPPWCKPNRPWRAMSILLSKHLTTCYGLHEVYMWIHLLRPLSITYRCLTVFSQFASRLFNWNYSHRGRLKAWAYTKVDIATSRCHSLKWKLVSKVFLVEIIPFQCPER